jgi:hypothetical protein
MKWLTYIMNVG